MRVEKKVEVNAPLRQVYDQWTQFEAFPTFIEGVVEVRQIADDRLYWKADIAGTQKEWTAKITRQQPDQAVEWHSEDGAPNGGEVHFRPLADDLTEVDVAIDYDPEDFKERVGASLGLPARRIEGDLLRFKDFMERRGEASGEWRGRIGHQEPDTDGGAQLGSVEADRLRSSTTSQPSGRSPADIGQTGRSDLGREGLGSRDPGGRGAMAYGGHGDVGVTGRSSPSGGAGGEGRGSEGGPLGGRSGRTGGLGGQGRGQEGVSRGGGASAGNTPGMGGFPKDVPDAAPEPGQRPDAASTMGDVGFAGGAGNLNQEDRIAGQGLRDPGGPGQESMSTEGTDDEGANRSGPAGDDRPLDYRGEDRPPSREGRPDDEADGRP